MAIFPPKAWVNPFGKMPIFRVFDFFFYSLKGRFFVLKYRNRHFLCLYFLKTKSWKNGHFWTKTMENPLETPLEKCQFFGFFELLVFIAYKGVFCSRIS